MINDNGQLGRPLRPEDQNFFNIRSTAGTGEPTYQARGFLGRDFQGFGHTQGCLRRRDDDHQTPGAEGEGQLSACAKRSARVRLPTPEAPVNR